jgi:hypothetical protein
MANQNDQWTRADQNQAANKGQGAEIGATHGPRQGAGQAAGGEAGLAGSKPGQSAAGAADISDAVTERGRQAVDTVSSLAEQARTAAGRSGEAAWQTAQRISSQGSEVARQAYTSGRQAVSYVSRQAEDHVFATLLAGLAIGAFIGYLFATRR